MSAPLRLALVTDIHHGAPNKTKKGDAAQNLGAAKRRIAERAEMTCSRGSAGIGAATAGIVSRPSSEGGSGMALANSWHSTIRRGSDPFPKSRFRAGLPARRSIAGSASAAKSRDPRQFSASLHAPS